MNIAATYNMLPDLTLAVPARRYVETYPVSRPEDSANVPVKTDADPSSNDARTYKYYVLADSSNMVYTPKKQMEKLFAADKGALVDVYV